jgi:hypothetical protein
MRNDNSRPLGHIGKTKRRDRKRVQFCGRGADSSCTKKKVHMGVFGELFGELMEPSGHETLVRSASTESQVRVPSAISAEGISP